MKETNNVTILNYTPHQVDIVGFNAIPSNGVARVGEAVNDVDIINGISIIKKTFSEVVGLPSAVNGVFIIVSFMVAQALPDRVDLLIPGELVRNELGKVTGCKNLCRP